MSYEDRLTGLMEEIRETYLMDLEGRYELVEEEPQLQRKIEEYTVLFNEFESKLMRFAYGSPVAFDAMIERLNDLLEAMDLELHEEGDLDAVASLLQDWSGLAANAWRDAIGSAIPECLRCHQAYVVEMITALSAYRRQMTKAREDAVEIAMLVKQGGLHSGQTLLDYVPFIVEAIDNLPVSPKFKELTSLFGELASAFSGSSGELTESRFNRRRP